MSQSPVRADRTYALPPLGDNPSTERQGTTPGSFALKGRVGTPYAYGSPDTPGMPGVSDLTAMDFAGPRDREGRTQLEAARSGVVTTLRVASVSRATAGACCCSNRLPTCAATY